MRKLFAARGFFGIVLALACGTAWAALPQDETLFDKVAEVGRTLGFHEAYQDRAEGLFIWRIVARDPGGAESCNGFFVWYLKPAADKVALLDGVTSPGCRQTTWWQGEADRLRDDFKRRWLATVGPIPISSGATTHAPGLAASVVGMLSLESDDRVNREPPQTAPVGFAWRRLAEINGFVLVPEGWFVKRVTDRRAAQVVSYFVSQQNIDAAGSFQTGLTLNVLIAQSRSVDAEAYAKSVIAGVVGRPNTQVLRPAWDMPVGGFHHYDCVVRVQGKDGPLVVENRVIVNTTTKTTYTLIFESPESGWKNASDKGAKLVELLSLDERI